MVIPNKEIPFVRLSNLREKNWETFSSAKGAKVRAAREVLGSGGYAPQKILKFEGSETPFLAFWKDNFCQKCSVN